MLTHSPTLHTAQSRGFAQTLAKASAKLAELADTLARGHTRRPRDKVETEITQITRDPWTRRVITWDSPARAQPSTGSPTTSTNPPAPTWKPRSSANVS